MESLETMLAGSSVPERFLEPRTFERLAAYGRGVVEAGGIRGQDADVLVQRVLSELRAGPLDPEGNVTLRAALRHRLHLAALHFWRAEKRRRRHLARAGETGPCRAPDAPSSDPAVDDGLRLRVRRALERLPEGDRQALRLAYLASLPLEQVRQILGYRTLDVLYVRLSHARARLRDLLGSADLL